MAKVVRTNPKKPRRQKSCPAPDTRPAPPARFKFISWTDMTHLGESMEQTMQKALGSAGQAIGHFSTGFRSEAGKVARRVKYGAKRISQAVDPAALGGGLAGLTAGEVAGTAAGGAVGMAVAGPPGALIGGEIGALAVGSAGLRLGYDTSYDVLHHKKKQGKPGSIGQRVTGVGRTIARRSGDAVGSGVGAAGGNLVGTAIAGPVGGAIGSFIGETFGGDIVENSSVNAYDEETSKKSKKRKPVKPRKKVPWRKRFEGWVTGVSRDTLMETGTSMAGGAVGRLLGGPLGQTAGSRAGLIAARRVDWQDVMEGGEKPKTPKRKTRVRRPKPAKPTVPAASKTQKSRRKATAGAYFSPAGKRPPHTSPTKSAAKRIAK